MQFPYFIFKRLNSSENGSFSRTIHKVAVASVGFGLAAVLISIMILDGFQNTIREKVFALGGHLQVIKYTMGNSYEEEPISLNVPIYQNPDQFYQVTHVQEFANKAGLLKTDEDVYGVLLKGVSHSFDMNRFGPNIVEGRFPELPDSGYSREVMISRKIANKLKLGVGDKVLMYFIMNPIRYRPLTISGIYNTALEDFDEKVILGDLNMIRRLNDWPDSLAGGLELFVKDFKGIDIAQEKVRDQVNYDFNVLKVTDRYPQIFDWFTLLNQNVVILTTIIVTVALFNMISILLILIMERTQMIGLLKAMGANNKQIRQIFSYNGMRLTIRGMVIGNAVAIGFGLIQQQFKLIPLDPENYYMEFVPIAWNLPIMIGLNVGIFLLTSLVLVLPTWLITRIKPIKAIRFS
ncbi:ABC transporter permease [Roseivirga sp. BDSF3-8]|uniref:ABC transporter permease n=1 Tax=Roseivirga sp. BDSF3-8 TaxID=3241598 RepID=UPI003531AB27